MAYHYTPVRRAKGNICIVTTPNAAEDVVREGIQNNTGTLEDKSSYGTRHILSILSSNFTSVCLVK